MKSSMGNRGFSLLELLVVLGLTAIAATIAVPATSELRSQYQLRALADEIALEISKARMQAVARGVFTRVRFTDVGYIVETSEDGYTYTSVGTPHHLPTGLSVEAMDTTFGRTGLAASPVTISLEQNDSKQTLSVNILGRVTTS